MSHSKKSGQKLLEVDKRENKTPGVNRNMSTCDPIDQNAYTRYKQGQQVSRFMWTGASLRGNLWHKLHLFLMCVLTH